MMYTDDKYEEAIKILVNKAEELSRIPKRSDFDDSTACFIKQKLGPWPRALEFAGLKEKPAISSKEKSAIKRKRIKNCKKKANKVIDHENK